MQVDGEPVPAVTRGTRRLLFLEHTTAKIVSNFLLQLAINFEALFIYQPIVPAMKEMREGDPPNIDSTKLTETIVCVRGRRVIVDTDLARLYGVQTKRLKEQVKRNTERFPKDFMFEITQDEMVEVVAVCDHLKKLKFSSVLPLAFTEHGAVMAANVLNSRLAIEASIMVVRAFIHAREILAEHLELKRRLELLELKVARGFEDNEAELNAIRLTLHQLMLPRELSSKKSIGFGREK